jgi:hypothetical protein
MLYEVQRCQTNSDWATTFQFMSGNPATPLPIDSWTLQGKVQRTNLPANSLDLTYKLAVGVDPSQLTISLSKYDTLFLGAGRLVIEVLRVNPVPVRPILKFYFENHPGVVPLDAPVVSPLRLR